MQTDATLFCQTCCVRLHGATAVLVLVAYSLKPVKLLGPTTRNNAVTCCVRLHGPLHINFQYKYGS